MMIAWLMAASETAKVLQPSTAVDTTGQLVSMMISLMVVLAIAIGLAFLWRRFMPQSITGHHGLDIVASRNIGSRERLLLVKVGQRYVLLGATPQSINQLAEFTADELPEALSAVKQQPVQTWQLWRSKT
ncbi:flagellar biosynthetic protein FliO [Echinimonas agarilytica]|uniref:Flagellar protein n=1 Tax=Echinimonas agarilytica TaxID=1215918 RepID=A0AA41W504_9GAMM|nr:flagellar biosynthetic protein FliO [Echinimonas agarilytica]MCM2678976.1 flagellar biosynthetic protein FliO [Echinimonas agarilytica]